MKDLSSAGEDRFWMISVREVQPSEMDGVKVLIRDIFPDAMVQITDNDIVLLAEYSGKAVGFAHMIDEGDRLILQGIGVHKSMRGYGVGTILMDRILATLNEDRPVHLKVKALNPAIDLYARYGFFVRRFGQDVHVLVKRPNA